MRLIPPLKSLLMLLTERLHDEHPARPQTNHDSQDGYDKGRDERDPTLGDIHLLGSFLLREIIVPVFQLEVSHLYFGL